MSYSNGPKMVTNGLVLCVDVGNFKSCPASNTILNDLVGSNTFTLSSVTYNAEGSFSFYNNSIPSIITSSANSALDTQTPSVEMWVKPNTTFQTGIWFEKGFVNTQYALFQEGANLQWRIYINGVGLSTLSTTTATYISTSRWAHVVATYTSGTRRLYIDGVLVNSDTLSGTISTNTNGCSIGMYTASNGSQGYAYQGKLAICKVYNRALSASEVLQNYHANKGRFGL